MSSETATPKKSILTTAMERARVIKEAKENGEDVRTETEVRAKRILIRGAAVLAGTAAAVTAVIVIAKNVREDETSEEEQTED